MKKLAPLILSAALAVSLSACGAATVVALPDIGITDRRFMFREMNNKEIADRIENWLSERELN